MHRPCNSIKRAGFRSKEIGKSLPGGSCALSILTVLDVHEYSAKLCLSKADWQQRCQPMRHFSMMKNWLSSWIYIFMATRILMWFTAQENIPSMDFVLTCDVGRISAGEYLTSVVTNRLYSFLVLICTDLKRSRGTAISLNVFKRRLLLPGANVRNTAGSVLSFMTKIPIIYIAKTTSRP